MANHHNILSVLVVGLLGLSSFYFLPPTIGKVQPDAASSTTNQALAPMTSPQTFNTFATCFQNQCSGAIKYVFKPSGFAYWHNVGAGNVTLNGFSVGGQSRSVSAFSNSTTIDYRITVPNVVTMDIYFKETPTNGRPSNIFKVTMIGTSSVSGTFTWNFGNPQSFPVTCDNTKHILTYGTAGLNFTDATNFSAICTTTSVSFTIGVGAFKIDPSTIGTTTAVCAICLTTQRKGTSLLNGRFWMFYDDGTNLVLRSSTDAQTWSSSTTLRSRTGLCGAGGNPGFCLSLVFDYTNNKVYYQVMTTLGVMKYRAGTANSDGTITWDFVEQSFTMSHISGTNTQSGKGMQMTKDTNGNLDFSGTTYDGTSFYIEIWQCAAPISSCTPTKIDEINTGATQKAGVLVSFTSGRIGLLYQAISGNTVISITTCPSSCTGSGSWSAPVSTSNYVGLNFSPVTIGGTLYIVAEASATTLNTFNCAYPCSSLSSVTTLSSSRTAIGIGVTISTDGNTNLIIFYADSGTNSIGYFLSINTGTTWSADTTLVSSQTNLVIAAASYDIINNVVTVAWVAGASSPFNVRFQTFALNTPSIIQSTSCTGTGSTVNCAFASNTKAGSSLVVFAGSTATTTVSGVTDTQSLTYSQIVGSDVGTVGDSEAWWACHPSTAAADTVTVSYSLSVTATIILYELHGRPTGTSCGPSSSTGSSASSSTAAVGSYTPRANAFIIGALDSSCQIACTITAGSGYSLDKNVAINAVNDFTTEFFWNVATADTTPYTFSVASAYNEISVAFYDLVWNNNTLADSATPSEKILRTPTPSVKDSVSLSDAKVRTFIPLIADSLSLAETAFRGAIITLKDTFNIIVTIPIIAGGGIPKNVVIEPNLIVGNAVAMLAMLLIPVGVFVLHRRKKR